MTLSGVIMRETDDTPIEKPLTIEERLKRTEDWCAFSLRQIHSMLEKIRELEAKVEDLHATDSARRLNMATRDPEWY